MTINPMRKTNELLTFAIWCGIVVALLNAAMLGLLIMWESRMSRAERDLERFQREVFRAMR